MCVAERKLVTGNNFNEHAPTGNACSCGDGANYKPIQVRNAVTDNLNIWTSSCGLVAMTTASHAEGRQFDPGQVYISFAPRTWGQRCGHTREFLKKNIESKRDKGKGKEGQ